MKTNFNIHFRLIILLICLLSGQSLFAQKVNAPLPAEWKIQNQTPATHLVLIPAEVISALELQPGDYLGAFTSDGHCAGVLQVDKADKNYCLTLYGDDPFTSGKDGFDEGESISLRLIAPTSGKETRPEIHFDPAFPNGGFFAANGISKVKTGALEIETQEVVSKFEFTIFPNPAKDRVTVVWSQESVETAHLVIYNAYGQVMVEQNIVATHRGTQYNEIDISGLSQGAYFVKLNISRQSALKKMLVFL